MYYFMDESKENLLFNTHLPHTLNDLDITEVGTI